MNDHEKEIIKNLERCGASGYRHDQIFEDWLDLVKVSLEALPRHLASASKGEPLTDTPEVQEFWSKIMSRYKGKEYLAYFGNAFGALLLASADGWGDTIGDVYMQFAYPNSGTGQFFTSWNIAVCMAEMTMMDTEKLAHDRVKEALAKTPIGQAILLASLTVQDPGEVKRLFYEKVVPAALPFIEPITVMDPCVGSGVMLLAAASMCPRWVIDFGIIQFYGVDIDPTCVKMTQVNLMLYGLNGFGVKCASALTPDQLEKLPENYAVAYTEVQELTAAGETEKVEQIAFDLRRNQYNFFNAFQTEEVEK